jgi:hypothetical protein
MVYYLFLIGAVVSIDSLEFFCEKVALGQVLLRSLRFSPVVFPLSFHAHLHLYKET